MKGLSYLSELAQNAVAFLAHELLNGSITENCIFMLANLHTTAWLCENVKPSISWQFLGDQDTLLSLWVVHLKLMQDVTSCRGYLTAPCMSGVHLHVALRPHYVSLTGRSARKYITKPLSAAKVLPSRLTEALALTNVNECLLDITLTLAVCNFTTCARSACALVLNCHRQYHAWDHCFRYLAFNPIDRLSTVRSN